MTTRGLRPGHVTATPTPRWISWYLIAVGVGVGVLWTASLPGAFQDGLFTYAGTSTAGNVPFFHILAEAIMAATALTAGLLWRRGSRRAPTVTLLANGMLAYSAINSSGWLLHNQPAVTVLTGATLVGAIASTWNVLRRRLRPAASHGTARDRATHTSRVRVAMERDATPGDARRSVWRGPPGTTAKRPRREGGRGTARTEGA
jgi:hypothetical protein